MSKLYYCTLPPFYKVHLQFSSVLKMTDRQTEHAHKVQQHTIHVFKCKLCGFIAYSTQFWWQHWLISPQRGHLARNYSSLSNSPKSAAKCSDVR